MLVGLTDTDNQEVVEYMASQTLNIRLWDKDGVAWSDSVLLFALIKLSKLSVSISKSFQLVVLSS